MNKIKIIILLLLILFPPIINGNDIKEKAEEFIKSVCGDNVEYNFSIFKIPIAEKRKIEKLSAQSFFRDEVIVWQIKTGGKIVSYAIMDNVYGKALPITFMVIFETNGKIIESSIIKYREQYGSGVSNKEWQKQFKAKGKDSSFAIGDEIQAISGATISVKSVTRGIQKLTLLFESVKSYYENSSSSIR